MAGRWQGTIRTGQYVGTPTSPEELLARLGVDAAGAEFTELAHNRWLTPGVWRVRNDAGLDAVLKYNTAGRNRGKTSWDSHWTGGDQTPPRWTKLGPVKAWWSPDGMMGAFLGRSAPIVPDQQRAPPVYHPAEARWAVDKPVVESAGNGYGREC